MTADSPAVVANFTPQLEQAREAIVAGITPGVTVFFVGTLNAATSYLAGRVA